MEMKLGYAKESGGTGVRFWPVYLCYLIFGLLLPLSKEEWKLTGLLVSAVIALVMGGLMVRLLIMLFHRGNGALFADNKELALEAIRTGMLFMIPFTALAVLAQLLLDWNAVMPFASAAIMTSTASAGTEAMKKGAKGIKNILIPSLLAFVFSTGWMMLVAILP